MYVYFANGMPGSSSNVSMDSDMFFTSFADMCFMFLIMVACFVHVLGCFFGVFFEPLDFSKSATFPHDNLDL